MHNIIYDRFDSYSNFVNKFIEQFQILQFQFFTFSDTVCNFCCYCYCYWVVAVCSFIIWKFGRGQRSLRIRYIRYTIYLDLQHTVHEIVIAQKHMLHIFSTRHGIDRVHNALFRNAHKESDKIIIYFISFSYKNNNSNKMLELCSHKSSVL